MTVRRATPGDAEALAEVAAATFALACPPATTEAAIADFIATSLTAEAFTRYLADPDRALLVDDPGHGARLGGYTMVVGGEPAAEDVAAAVRIRPTAELSKCYLRAELHGRGAASALLNHSIDLARERGALGMWLGTNRENARAIRFYAKHGFTPVGTRRFRVGGVDEHDVVLERALSSPPRPDGGVLARHPAGSA